MAEIDLPTEQSAESLDCVCFQLRRAARKASRHYDNALKGSGLRNTQFSLLGALDHVGCSSIGALSERLAIDGTTLSRNLDVLVRRGLVENLATDDGRVRNLRLTEFGKITFAATLPAWRRAQQQMLDALGTDRWGGLRSGLSEIEAACDGKP